MARKQGGHTVSGGSRWMWGASGQGGKVWHTKSGGSRWMWGASGQEGKGGIQIPTGEWEQIQGWEMDCYSFIWQSENLQDRVVDSCILESAPLRSPPPLFLPPAPNSEICLSGRGALQAMQEMWSANALAQDSRTSIQDVSTFVH